MSLITVACGVLSWRHASLLIAVLGLTGGFATPFLIAAKSDNPIGLFGYVLLLDLGLIALARRRGWSALTLLALVGTVFYQGFWILTRMDSDGELLGLAIVGLFALVFGFAGWSRRGPAAAPATGASRLGWLVAQGAGLLVPLRLRALFRVARRSASGDSPDRAAPPDPVAGRAVDRAAHPGRRGARVGRGGGSVAVVLVWSWDIG
jgi:hypothetical protein